MIKIGLQTKGILPDLNVSKGLKFIKDAGFDTIDFNLDAFLKNSDLYNGVINTFFDSSMQELNRHFAEYKTEMDRLGLTASQIHAPYPIWVDLKWKQNDYVMKNVIPKSIMIAKTMGIPWVVIHPIKIQNIHGKKSEIANNIAYYKSLIPILKEYGVGVCVEDLYESIGGRIVEGPCADPKEAIYYVDTLNEYAGEELFGVCLDTGHLQLIKRNPNDYIREVGARIKVLHLHENDGRYDLHQMPLTFGKEDSDGLDWKAIAHALRDVSFDGSLSFETFPCTKAFPKELLLSALETIHAIGEYMKAEIEG